MVASTEIYEEALQRIVAAGLAEDVGRGDVTSEATIPLRTRARAVLRQKAPGVVAGLDAAEAVFRQLDPEAEFAAVVQDGDETDRVPRVLARVEGDARAILAGERLALNLCQRMSGIATLTARYVAAVAGTGARVLDTRKTVPGLRLLDKRAVALGGGTNHRIGLFDAILIKDNHIAVAGGVAAAVTAARRHRPDLPLEVEARTEAEVAEAVAAGVDRILLDNMSPERLRRAVQSIAGRAATEASGGIDLHTIRAVAETGVDFISVGALTHSVPALDISLDVETLKP